MKPSQVRFVGIYVLLMCGLIVGFTIDEKRLCNVNGVNYPFTGLRIEKSYITKGANPPLYHASALLLCDNGEIDYQRLNKMNQRSLDFMWGKVYCRYGIEQDKMLPGGKAKMNRKRVKANAMVKARPVKLQKFSKIASFGNSRVNYEKRNIQKLDLIKTRKLTGNKNVLKEVFRQRALLQKAKKKTVVVNEVSLGMSPMHSVDFGVSPEKKIKVVENMYGGKSQFGDRPPESSEVEDLQKVVGINAGDERRQNDQKFDPNWDRLVCYKLTRRKHLSKRKFIVTGKDNWVGGIFQCTPDAESIRTIARKPMERNFQAYDDIRCVDGIAISPLISEDILNQWTQTGETYQIKRVPLFYTPEQLDFRLQENNRDFTDQLVPANWSEYLDVNERYEFSSDEILAIEEGTEQSIEYYKWIEKQEYDQMPWYQKDAMNNEKQTRELVTLLKYLSLPQRVTMILHGLRSYKARKYLDDLSEIWENVESLMSYDHYEHIKY